MKLSQKHIPRTIAAAVAALILVLAAYTAGRRTAGPGIPTVAGQAEVGHPEVAQGTGHAGEAGVVSFSEEAMKNARLTIQSAAVSAVRAPLPVTGKVEPNLGGVVTITPRVAGKITSVSVNVGDTVRAGATLARIASTDLAEAQAAYRQAGSRVAVARQIMARQRRLAGLGEFSGHKVEDARRETAEAEGELGTAKSEVTAARSEIAQAESGAQALEAALEQARTQAEVARSRSARAQTLFGEQLVSRQDLEQAQADVRDAEAGVRAAQANMAKGRSGVETAESRLGVTQARFAAADRRAAIAARAQSREELIYRGGYATSKEIVEAEAAVRQSGLEQQAAADQVRLLGGMPGGGDTVAVTAPLGGRVTERTVTLGETVGLEKTLFTVVNLNSVWVQLHAYSRDLPAIRTGQKVTVTSDTAPGRTFAGAVSYIGDVVDETTRTVKVRAVIGNADGALKPGTFVRGTLDTGNRTQAITVPREAVQTMEGKTVLFVQGDHEREFQAREVQTGDTSGDRVIITQGIKAGDKVVTKGAFTVKAQAMKGELGEGGGH